MNSKLPNIRDVARAAGVSTATVSRTLSNPEIVSEKTKDLVLEAIRRTGYSVNRIARNLRRRETGGIVVLVPNLANPFFSQILSSIADTMSVADYNVLIADTARIADGERRILEFLNNNRADGLIILDGNLPKDLIREQTEAGSLPPVIFACEWMEGHKGPSVTIDNKAAAADAIGHLAGLGHRSIGHLCGPPGNVLTTARMEGTAAAIRDAGLEVRDDWFFKGDFSMDSGAEAARRWSALGDRPTAIFSASDEMAFGFISQAHRMEIDVPRDVSVVGFDDIETAAYFIPPLTTIHQPRAEIGRFAAEMLIETMKTADEDRGPSAPKSRILPVELIERESTYPPSGK